MVEQTSQGTATGGYPMTDNVENLVLEHLRAIRADLADLKREMVNNTLQIAALGQPVAGLTTAVYGGKSDFEEMKRRLERLERRLELREATP
jgi:hypothetical protein